MTCSKRVWLDLTWSQILVTCFDMTCTGLWLYLRIGCDLIYNSQHWLGTWLGTCYQWLRTWLGLAKNDLLTSLLTSIRSQYSCHPMALTQGSKRDSIPPFKFLDSYLNTKHFFNGELRAAVHCIFIHTQHYCSVIKCSCGVFSDDQQNPVLRAWNALNLKWNFFPNSWIGIALGIAFFPWGVFISIYQIDAYDLKKQKCSYARERWKKCLVFKYESRLLHSLDLFYFPSLNTQSDGYLL